MARNPRKSGRENVAKLAESLMPGWTAVKTPRSAPAFGQEVLKDNLRKAGVDVVTMPSLDKLKAKYAGFTGADGGGSNAEEEPLADNPDTAIVNLQNGPLRKTIAISKSARKVLWSQG